MGPHECAVSDFEGTAWVGPDVFGINDDGGVIVGLQEEAEVPSVGDVRDLFRGARQFELEGDGVRRAAGLAWTDRRHPALVLFKEGVLDESTVLKARISSGERVTPAPLPRSEQSVFFARSD